MAGQRNQARSVYFIVFHKIWFAPVWMAVCLV